MASRRSAPEPVAGPGRPGRAPTIHDVAAACGVAASTVSRAFSRPERVNAATRARVLEIAEQMGYRPSPIARALPSGRTTTLGLLIPDVTNPFFFNLIRGAERQAAAAGYTIVLADTDESAEVEATLVDRLFRAVDGFVLASSRLSDRQLKAAHARGPVILVNRRVPPVPGVVIDSTHGLRRATEHLVSLGHRKIVYLGGPRASWSDASRWRALQSACRRLDVDLVRIGPLPPTVDAGVAAADAVLLEEATAVVTFNDLLAIGVIRRLHARGISVPGDISVLGNDDIFGADFCHPPLTTLAAPIETAGRAAVDLLLAALAGDSAESRRQVILPTRLTIRDSTGPAPASSDASRHTRTPSAERTG